MIVPISQSGLRILYRGSLFDSDFGGWLIFAQTLERCRPHHSAVGPVGELDLGDELGPHPMDIRLRSRCVVATEGTFGRRQRFQSRKNSLNDILSKASSNAAGIGETAVPMHPHQQRSEVAGGIGPSANHDFLARTAFDFYPIAG